MTSLFDYDLLTPRKDERISNVVFYGFLAFVVLCVVLWIFPASAGSSLELGPEMSQLSTLPSPTTLANAQAEVRVVAMASDGTGGQIEVLGAELTTAGYSVDVLVHDQRACISYGTLTHWGVVAGSCVSQ